MTWGDHLEALGQGFNFLLKKFNILVIRVEKPATLVNKTKMVKVN